jgi:glucose/arabinose dehydrogenase
VGVALKLFAALSLSLTSAWLVSCAETTTSSALGDASRENAAPLARVTFTSKRNQSVTLKDRLSLFDRVAFSSPSAVVHDRERDLYWVSNLNVDGPGGKGFISRLQPDGSLSTLNFIDGRKEGVQLVSPQGLAVSGNSLYVADVTAIRKFDANDGAPEASIVVPGARYLSDVAVASDGSLYVTDVGSDPTLAAVPQEGSDAVYKIMPSGEVSVVARRPDLGGPFALLADETGLWIACTGSADLLLLVPSADGTASEDAGRLHLSGESLRGIAAMPDGTLLISSWGGRAVYRGFRDGPFEPAIRGLESPADLDYDVRRKRLLVPLLTGHALAVFDLAPFTPSAPKR